jgi:hypothetical protein
MNIKQWQRQPCPSWPGMEELGQLGTIEGSDDDGKAAQSMDD